MMMDQMDAAEQCVSNTDGPSIAFIKHYNKNKYKKKMCRQQQSHVYCDCGSVSNNLSQVIRDAITINVTVMSYQHHKLRTPIKLIIILLVSPVLRSHFTKLEITPPDGKLCYSSYSFG